MKLRTGLCSILAAFLLAGLISCTESPQAVTGEGAGTVSLSPRLALAQGADTALYNSTLNVRVRLAAGTLTRDTLLAFSLRRCTFDGLETGVGYQLSFVGLDAKGDTLWTGTRVGVAGEDLSVGVQSQIVTVPVRLRDRTAPVLASSPADTVVPSGVGAVRLDWILVPEKGIAANLNGTALAVGNDGLVRATVSVAEGATLCILSLADSASNQVLDTVVVTRLPAPAVLDSQAPVLKRGPADAIVAYGVTGMNVQWVVAGEPGLSALLDGGPVTRKGDTLSASISLAVGESKHVLVVQDSLGNAVRDTVVLTRLPAPDLQAPLFLERPADSVVPNGTNQLALRWKVGPEAGLAATLEGVILSGAQGVYTKTVSLAAGANVLVFHIADSAGNAALDTVRIQRELPLDVDAPVILTAPNDTVVDSPRTMKFGWKVRLEAKMLVKINGVAVGDSGGVFYREISLDTGKNVIALDAQDSLGNSVLDTVSVTVEVFPPDHGVPWNPNVRYGKLVDARDGQVYRTVRIGNQTWMAQNLAYKGIPGSQDTVGVCLDSCGKYGRYYDWAEAMALPANAPSADYSSSMSTWRGICPEGWRIPDETDFKALKYTVGDSSAGRVLKSATGWLYQTQQWDYYGFRALPSGLEYDSNRGYRSGAGSNANWWIAYPGIFQVRNFSNEWHVASYHTGDERLVMDYYPAAFRLSVRCILR